MPFGLSFGAKKQKSTTNTDLNMTETLAGSQSSATTGVQQGTSSTTNTGTTTQQGTQTNVQSTDQAQTDRGTQSQSGTTTTLSSDVVSALSDKVKQVLAGGVTDANIASLSNQIAGSGDFNPDSFVEGIVGSARNRGEQALQESDALNGMAIGGTSDTNSMAALLAARGRNDLEANLAGITAQARAQAEGIRNQNLATGAGAQAQLASIAGGLAETAKGGQTTVDMKTLTDQISELIGNQTNATTSQQTGTSAEQSNTATTQLLAEIVNALTNQTSSKVGTETSKTKGSNMGGGLSFGL